MDSLMLTADNTFVPVRVLRRKYQIHCYQDCWVAVDDQGQWVGLLIH